MTVRRRRKQNKSGYQPGTYAHERAQLASVMIQDLQPSTQVF
jgi:hypothetical protein